MESNIDFDERDLEGIRKIVNSGILSSATKIELKMFWIKYSTLLQLKEYLNKNIKLVQESKDSGNNVKVVYVLKVKYVEESEKCRVKIYSDQINILYYEDDKLQSSVIHTKDPNVCDQELSITVDSENYKYLIKELTDGEYEEEIIKSIYLHYEKGKETETDETLGEA